MSKDQECPPLKSEIASPPYNYSLCPTQFVRSSSAASCLVYPKALAQAMAVANLYNMTLCVVDMDLFFLCFVSGLFVVCCSSSYNKILEVESLRILFILLRCPSA